MGGRFGLPDHYTAPLLDSIWLAPIQGRTGEVLLELRCPARNKNPAAVRCESG